MTQPTNESPGSYVEVPNRLDVSDPSEVFRIINFISDEDIDSQIRVLNRVRSCTVDPVVIKLIEGTLNTLASESKQGFVGQLVSGFKRVYAKNPYLIAVALVLLVFTIFQAGASLQSTIETYAKHGFWGSAK